MHDIEDLDDLIVRVRSDPVLREIHEHVTLELDSDPAHDVAHCLRVALWTLRFGGAAIDPRFAICAALLHDVVNVPKDSPERARASELSAERARELLAHHGFESEEIALVAGAIRDHSFSRGAIPESLLGKALQDADRLEALGAIGVLRCATTGVRMGARPFDAADPFAESRAFDERRFSIDHFFTKLLGLPETMQTPGGRREAEHRAQFLRSFLAQLGSELGRELPPR